MYAYNRTRRNVTTKIFVGFVAFSTILTGVGISIMLASRSANAAECTLLSFHEDASGNSILAGQIIDDEYSDWGITISTNNHHGGHPDIGVAFDTSNPTGGDTDLGTPNEDFGGPGIGDGGAEGEEGENSISRGMALIIAENDADADDNDLIDVPDDEASGGTVTFTFDTLVHVESLILIDNDSGGSNVKLYDGSNNPFSVITPSNTGDNSIQEVVVDRDGVLRMEVKLSGAAAIDDLCVTPQEVNQPPVVNLIGDAEMTITQGDTFTDPGATATDPEDGDITDDIEVSGDTVNTNVPGTYVIKYRVTDSDGLCSEFVTRTVHVVEAENQPPVWSGPTEATTTVGDLLGLTITATDPDNDPLTITTDIPTGASYVATTSAFTWTPTATGTYSALFTASDGEATSTHTLTIHVVPFLPDISNKECTNGDLYGWFYNLPKTHPDVNGPITGVISGTTPFDYDWYDDQYLSFAENVAVSSLNQTSNYFPVDDGLAGDPLYFAAHFTGFVHVAATSTHTVQLGSDDDSWFYLNGVETMNLGGVHAFKNATSSVAFPAGTSTIDVYFAERHKSQSALRFSIFGSGITYNPCEGGDNGGGDENELPIWTGPTEATTTVSDLLSLTITATDPDNDPLTITTDVPTGASYVATSSLFTWTPTATGTYSALFEAFDGTGTSTHILTVNVVPEEDNGGGGGGGNTLPVWSGPTIATTTVNTLLNLTLTVTDADNDPLTITTTLPATSTYATTTSLFTWTPTATGTYPAIFNAFDGTGTSTHSLSVIVIEADGQGGSGEEPEDPPAGGGGGGGSSGGGGGGGGGGDGGRQLVPSIPPILAQGGGSGSAVPSVPVIECSYLRDFLRIDFNNDPVEVKKVQSFLNIFNGESLPVDGVFDQVLYGAVVRFQEKYFDDVLAPWGHTEGTGYVYLTTRKKINEIYCNRPYPLTAEQLAEVAAFKAYLLSLNTGSVGGGTGGGEGFLPPDLSGQVGGIGTDATVADNSATSRTSRAFAAVRNALGDNQWILVLFLVAMLGGGAYWVWSAKPRA